MKFRITVAVVILLNALSAAAANLIINTEPKIVACERHLIYDSKDIYSAKVDRDGLQVLNTAQILTEEEIAQLFDYLLSINEAGRLFVSGASTVAHFLPFLRESSRVGVIPYLQIRFSQFTILKKIAQQRETIRSQLKELFPTKKFAHFGTDIHWFKTNSVSRENMHIDPNKVTVGINYTDNTTVVMSTAGDRFSVPKDKFTVWTGQHTSPITPGSRLAIFYLFSEY